MDAIESINKVREYPDHGANYDTAVISNHWNCSDKVVFTIGDKSYVFVADHLRRAITNACNAHR